MLMIAALMTSVSIAVGVSADKLAAQEQEMPTSEDSRYPFPFTRNEVVAAYLRFPGATAEEAQQMAEAIFSPDNAVIGVDPTHDTLLMLASLSDDAAARAIRYNPGIRRQVEAMLLDREGFMRRLGESD